MRHCWRKSSEGLCGWWGDWSISPMRKGWRSWACLAAYKYLKGECQEGGARTFFSGAQWQDKGKQAQTEAWEVPAEHEEEFVYFEGTEHWNRLPRGVVASPSLDIFKTCQDKVLYSLLWVTLLWQGDWARWSSEVPSNPYCSVISV